MNPMIWYYLIASLITYKYTIVPPVKGVVRMVKKSKIKKLEKRKLQENIKKLDTLEIRKIREDIKLHDMNKPVVDSLLNEKSDKMDSLIYKADFVTNDSLQIENSDIL